MIYRSLQHYSQCVSLYSAFDVVNLSLLDNEEAGPGWHVCSMHSLDYTKQDEKQNSSGEGVQPRSPSRKLILLLYTNLCFCRMLNA